MNLTEQDLLIEKASQELEYLLNYHSPADRLALSYVGSFFITAIISAIVGICVGLYFLTKCLYKKYCKCKLKNQLLDQEVVV